MRAWTREEARQVDELAQIRFRLPGDLLMENAGGAVARFAHRVLAHRPDAAALVLCGPGNNGGDGYVAARHLEGNARVTCVSLGDPNGLRGDARSNAERYRALGGTIEADLAVERLERWLVANPHGIVLDALFGIGLDRPIQGLAGEWIETVNRADTSVLAVDIPSGLDCDDGHIHGCAVKATWTITFVARKVGFDRGAGPRVCGEVIVEPIGFPLEKDPRTT